MTARRRFTPLLAASLLLNVFLLGSIGGGLYHWRNQQAVLEPDHAHGLRQALAQLPEARRHELRLALRQSRSDNQNLLAARREARQAVVQRLREPRLDREALDRDLSKAREADGALRAQVDTLLADFAGNLAPDERQTLAQSVYSRDE
ncbi:MAG: periplasmic heavy metal sensor [Janthinobacterium lividum]|jgi:uncharacterized membrane protein|uniref:periplasmic heavy metal sensor n=1 Tax=Pseudomonas TaxID=286 RepID=UPI001CFBFDFB|nr:MULTISPECIES: periplasmic heavy metal sensor [Pseudomonas]